MEVRVAVVMKTIGSGRDRGTVLALLYSPASFTRIVKARRYDNRRHKESHCDNRKGFVDGALTSDNSIVKI
jgi:hypothetical protein